MLTHPLTKELLRTTDPYIKSLAKGGVVTVGDFLSLYPKDYEDRSTIVDNFSMITLKEKNTLLVKLVSIENQKTANGKLLTKAIIEDKNGFLSECVWFNRNYLSQTLSKFKDKKVLIIGKAKYEYGKLSFLSPEVEWDLSKMSVTVVPVYSDVNYIPWSWIASKMPVLRNFIKEYTDELPESIREKYRFMSFAEALEILHFPANMEILATARERLAYQELYDINFVALSKKHSLQEFSTGKTHQIPLDPELVKKILDTLPYALTNAQKISLFQVLKDMEKPHAMERLLEWDVGTGKTVVAWVALVHALLQSRSLWFSIQWALMAPTEILARQHAESLFGFFESFGLKSMLLVGSMTKKQKDTIKAYLVSWQIDVMIGTHALIQEDVYFEDLWLVVIDEQHRFWVKQREILEKWLCNRSHFVPHNLNMTATPIPRTLALTLYGDQDISLLNEYPAGRKHIHTKAISVDSARQQIELFIRNELEKGRQVFWISPLVEESEKIDLANAISTYESLVEIFSPFRVGLLHGKMKAKDKEDVMSAFAHNEIQILSSTSVVEVGINVPNATIMCIEWAERFGLSQLHQFRGRVGRWAHQSYCYLFPSKWQKTDRLKAMEKTNDGFVLSEIDLELRGPWEVYGVRQSGVPELKLAQLTDLTLIAQIREDIEEMMGTQLGTI